MEYPHFNRKYLFKGSWYDVSPKKPNIQNPTFPVSRVLEIPRWKFNSRETGPPPGGCNRTVRPKGVTCWITSGEPMGWWRWILHGSKPLGIIPIPPLKGAYKSLSLGVYIIYIYIHVCIKYINLHKKLGWWPSTQFFFGKLHTSWFFLLENNCCCCRGNPSKWP